MKDTTFVTTERDDTNLLMGHIEHLNQQATTYDVTPVYLMGRNYLTRRNNKTGAVHNPSSAC